MVISRKFYLENYGKYTREEEIELVNFCKAEPPLNMIEWYTPEQINEYDRLNKMVIRVSELRRER